MFIYHRANAKYIVQVFGQNICTLTQTTYVVMIWYILSSNHFICLGDFIIFIFKEISWLGPKSFNISTVIG
jgi:hypothetical protein